ncbi:MAG: hypothetical protein A3C84_02600 [Candidatus Ryanbacteria bacterium RIFCSPHIGHO2_02_FULL_48_12]|uniref:Uncharacterized protein n=1 Tax=Candidatus Ryanbacteria bacterium RIFCSPHIGHO2_01_FULL_48_27 TaxID=1802115 RepID=A0A1G2G4Q4_9BACT|nr:MAG: hypothetical protein A2756_01075 [Candidatus Ryanbacteria bacterium RIFCSPHIGHO2_01_FULL_48_27]OGZ49002.1 MAG: hypothetical protein A3C84_02600 [Candidatus Ryanbacteria bacterium RIFCSPHIGHO2_02_FULL_48_12]
MPSKETELVIEVSQLARDIGSLVIEMNNDIDTIAHGQWISAKGSYAGLPRRLRVLARRADDLLIKLTTLTT